MSDLVNGNKNDITKPGLTPNIPDWADKVINKKAVGIVLETAHPAKFGEIVKDSIGREPSIPDRLEKVLTLPDLSAPMKADYTMFKDWLMSNL
jgi:threonine synthase